MSRVSRKRSAANLVIWIAPAAEPTVSAPSECLPAPFFHTDSDAIRFWVNVDGHCVGATVGRHTLHYRFRPEGRDEDPMKTFHLHASVMELAVRRRVRQGSIEPVMLREYDLVAHTSA